MEMVLISPQRKAQLDDHAHRHGQDTAAALDEALANYFSETVTVVGEGL